MDKLEMGLSWREAFTIHPHKFKYNCNESALTISPKPRVYARQSGTSGNCWLGGGNIPTYNLQIQIEDVAKYTLKEETI